MVGGVVSTHAELDEVDQIFWDNATASERLTAIWQMALDAIVIDSGQHASSGLQGPTCGTRRRAG